LAKLKVLSVYAFLGHKAIKGKQLRSDMTLQERKVRLHCALHLMMHLCLKVSLFQNKFMKSSVLPKYEQKIDRISALEVY
jgi:hypothetical protein